MPDPRFFSKQTSLGISQVLELTGANCSDYPADLKISDVAGLNEAGTSEISFLDNKKYLSALAETSAAAVILQPAYADRLPEGVLALTSDTPYRAFAQISQYFYPVEPLKTGVAPTAFVDPSATIGDGSEIQHGAVIHADVEIGPGCLIGANAVIDHAVRIGAGSRIGAGAYIGYSEIGLQANIHPGVRIGTRGFGFAMDQKGHIDVPQLGRVLIGDMVEIGANSTIDRGMGPDTVIGSGTKIDNLVQIGHNVRIGKGCVIVAMSGIAGSTVLEDFVVCAAKVGIAGHLHIGKGAQIAAKSGVMKNVGPGEKVGGTPAVPVNQWLRERLFINKLMQKKERNNG